METEFIHWLHARLGRCKNPSILLGVGDDGAILAPSDRPLVVVSDTIAEGTHFELSSAGLEAVGRKALAVNLSDLAAMAAQPMACLVNFQLPRNFEIEQAKQLFTGIEKLAEQFSVNVIGGDTNRWDGGLVVSVTAIGKRIAEVGGWELGGGLVGDLVLVSGDLGGSILGSHLTFEPRCALAEQLANKYPVNGATDISDSLSTDLTQMTGSAHGIVIDKELLPISDAAKTLAKQNGSEPIEHALHDGEDFELLITTSAEVAKEIVNDDSLITNMTAIGCVVSQPGLWLSTGDNPDSIVPLEAKGYEH